MHFLRKIKPIAIAIIVSFEALSIIFLLGLAFLTSWTNTSCDVAIVDPFTKTFLLTTESSYMEPTYGRSDILIIDKYEFNDKIEVGDVVCFTRFYEGRFVLATSRVFKMTTEANGANVYTVKDDGSDIPATALLSDQEIMGVYRGRGRLMGLGYLVEGLASSSPLFFCAIVLPMIVFFFANGFYVIWYMLDLRGRENEIEEN